MAYFRDSMAEIFPSHTLSLNNFRERDPTTVNCRVEQSLKTAGILRAFQKKSWQA